MIFLDPHTTQRYGCVVQKVDDEDVEMDETYHCKAASRIPISGIDPSVALVNELIIFICTKFISVFLNKIIVFFSVFSVQLKENLNHCVNQCNQNLLHQKNSLCLNCVQNVQHTGHLLKMLRLKP